MIRSTSIRRRVLRLVMVTTALALLLSASALLIYELRTQRIAWLQDLETQADLIARASVPALSFDDPRVAGETLALLRLRPQIEAAALYTPDGRLFASYTAAGQQSPPPLQATPEVGASAESVFAGEHVRLQRAIVQEGEPLGTLTFRARYQFLARVLGYAGILAAVMLASLALAGLVCTNLQRSITDPIVAISTVARQVVQTHDYMLRAPKTTHDEVGALVDAFNDMLQELGKQAQALRLADVRKDEFLATLAHELRNPLAPLSTALAILARDELDAAGRERTRQMMQRQVSHLTRLIDDLLEVSRISTGRLQLRAETIDILDPVRSAFESVAPAAQARRQQLIVAWPEQAFWVHGDRTRLAQIFVNLLSNAVRYTDPGGRIELSFTPTADEITVQVADNGIGIDPSMQAAVFEMFVQVDQSLGRGHAGLGVGLSLARQLVLLHGGSIELRSAGLGQGSTFSVRLGRVPGPWSGALAEPAAAAATPGRPTRVLVADDNRDSADSLAEVLRFIGYEVQVAYDGTAALQASAAHMPDVGLFDIGMPGLNGYELASAVRRLPGGAGIFLVALTGWGQTDDRRRAREAGFDHHFVKPVDVDVVADLVAARSGQAQARRADSPRDCAP